MRSKIFAVIACLLAPFSSEASNWAPITTGKGVEVFLDTESVAPRGTFVQAWLRWDYDEALQTRTDPQKTYRSNKALILFACSRKQFADVQGDYYSERGGGGEVVASYRVPENAAKLRDIVPGSLGALNLQVACAYFSGPTLYKKSVEAGCVDSPELVEGEMYKCKVSSGASTTFNVPGGAPSSNSTSNGQAGAQQPVSKQPD